MKKKSGTLDFYEQIEEKKTEIEDYLSNLSKTFKRRIKNIKIASNKQKKSKEHSIKKTSFLNNANNFNQFSGSFFY